MRSAENALGGLKADLVQLNQHSALSTAEAKHLIALDFMENLIQENKRINGSLGNIEFRAGDALQLSLPDGSLDVAFSNWLLMYLGDEEVQTLAANVLDWVRSCVPQHVLWCGLDCRAQSGCRCLY